MSAVARIVENVGVAAYLGAEHLISDPVLLSTAASIATIEARHQTVWNIFSGTGTVIPNAFDLPLKAEEVLAIARPFFDGTCDLGFKPNPTLTITNNGTVTPGTLLTFQSSALNGAQSNGTQSNGTQPDGNQTNSTQPDGTPANGTQPNSNQPNSNQTNSIQANNAQDNLFCQMMIGGNATALALPLSQCIVPQGLNGPVAIFITSDSTPLPNDVVNRPCDKVVAGPTMAFIDTNRQLLSELALGGKNNTGSGSDGGITQTISPASATAIGDAPSPTGTPGAAATSPPPEPFVGTKGGINNFVGTAGNGLIINGWKSVPKPSASGV